MAGAYPRDSDSIFGHTFLVYAPGNYSVSSPKNPPPLPCEEGQQKGASRTGIQRDTDVPFLNWTTVNFAADLQGSKWYELYTKGFSGGFSAYYFIMQLHEKINEYRGSETRDIRFFPIKVSDEEFERFRERLAEVKDTPTPYKFFTYNCSHGTYQLLYETLEGLPEPTTSLLSPLDVANMLYEANRLGEPFIMPPLMDRIREATDKEYAELEFMEWQNTQKNARHDAVREKKMASMRHSLAQRKVQRPELFVPDKKWVAPHKYSRVDVGAMHSGDGFAGVIGFRPLLHNFTDNQHYYSGISTLEILSTEVAVYEDKVSLNKIDVFHSRSTAVHDRWFRSVSYDLYAGYVDAESRFSVGLGKSFYLLSRQRLALEMLLMDSMKGGVNHIGFETQVLRHTDGRFRYGLRYEHLYKGFSDKKRLRLTSWVAFDINTRFGLYGENVVRDGEKGVVKVLVRWYF